MILPILQITSKLSVDLPVAVTGHGVNACKVLEAFDQSTDDIDELRQVQEFSRFEGYDHDVLFCASIEFLFCLLLFSLFFSSSCRLYVPARIMCSIL